MNQLPDLITESQTSEERFLRHIFIRDQMAEWSKAPLLMSRRKGFITGMSTENAISMHSPVFTLPVSATIIGESSRPTRKQLDTMAFSPPMHGSNPVAVQLATLLGQLAGDSIRRVPVRWQ
jgi:hypothetical protein